MIPLRSRTAAAVTFTSAPFFTYPTARASRREVRADSRCRDRRQHHLHEERRNRGQHSGPPPRPAPCSLQRDNYPADHDHRRIPPGMQHLRLRRSQINGCTVTTTARRVPDTSRHPYAMKFAGCANYDVFTHTGHSNGWHALDNESDNVDDISGLPGAVPSALFSGRYRRHPQIDHVIDQQQFSMKMLQVQGIRQFPSISKINIQHVHIACAWRDGVV